VAATTKKTILWACVSLYEKFQIDSKTDLLCNQDLWVISVELKNYPDRLGIQELRLKAQADIRSESFSKKTGKGWFRFFGNISAGIDTRICQVQLLPETVCRLSSLAFLGHTLLLLQLDWMTQKSDSFGEDSLSHPDQE
jgi:hypothetical protein